MAGCSPNQQPNSSRPPLHIVTGICSCDVFAFSCSPAERSASHLRGSCLTSSTMYDASKHSLPNSIKVWHTLTQRQKSYSLNSHNHNFSSNLRQQTAFVHLPSCRSCGNMSCHLLPTTVSSVAVRQKNVCCSVAVQLSNLADAQVHLRPWIAPEHVVEQQHGNLQHASTAQIGQPSCGDQFNTWPNLHSAGPAASAQLTQKQKKIYCQEPPPSCCLYHTVRRIDFMLYNEAHCYQHWHLPGQSAGPKKAGGRLHQRHHPRHETPQLRSATNSYLAAAAQ